MKQSKPVEDEYLKVKEAAHYLQVSPNTVYRLVKFGIIPSVNFGLKCTRIAVAALQTYVGQSNGHAATNCNGREKLKLPEEKKKKKEKRK